VFPEPTTELLIEVDLVAEMSVYNPFDFFLEESATEHPFTYEPVLKKDLAPFMAWPGAGPGSSRWWIVGAARGSAPSTSSWR
ncbi:MAG: hypothetical protein ACKOEQ_17430, partial [Verrucomicrobiota bacterium]